MGIINKDKLSKFIASWIINYCSSNQISSVVVPLYPWSESLLKGGTLICSLLTQNKNSTSPKILCFAQNSIYSQSLTQKQLAVNNIPDLDKKDLAIYMAKIAEDNKAILIGSLNRTDAKLSRNYGKYDSALADIFPLLDLYHSEVSELLSYIDPNIPHINEMTDLERADREEERSGLISSNNNPLENRAWVGYTLSQKETIAKLHQREKATRHKEIVGKPYPRVRLEKGLVA